MNVARRVFAIAGIAAVGLVGAAVPAGAQEPTVMDPTIGTSLFGSRGVGARIDRVEHITDTRTALFVDSKSMGRVVQVQVLHPANDAPRPSLYLLDGISAGEESDYSESTWTTETDLVDFVADKPVNVVLPIGGTGAYYTNWSQPDPELGQPQWETFLTQELPGIIDSEMNGNGVNSIGGLSMGAMGAGNLMARHPDLYRGLTAFSGCLDISDQLSRDSLRGTVASKGGNAANMWGPDGDPNWSEHNPADRLEALRGKQIYISSGTGLPGPHEMSPDALPKVALGGPLEAAAQYCTQNFERKLRGAAIPATVVYHPVGVHAWAYWEEEMHRAWPEIARGLGI